MFSLAKRVSKWYLERPLIIQDDGARIWLETNVGRCLLLMSQTSANILPETLRDDAAAMLIDPPVEIDSLKTSISKIKEVDFEWVVGIGGGRTNDAAKFIAKNCKKMLCLIPPILSTTSWLNMAIALREKNKLVLTFQKQPNKIIIDPLMISKAPPWLSTGGLADLACMASATGDWIIERETAGKKIAPGILRGLTETMEKIAQVAGSLDPFTPSAVQTLTHTFVDVLAACGGSMSGRPLEGSEHYMYYALDELDERRFVHGPVIALFTKIALFLQEKHARSFFPLVSYENMLKRLKLDVRPVNFDISKEDLHQVLGKMKKFIKLRSLPACICTMETVLAKKDDVQEVVDWAWNNA